MILHYPGQIGCIPKKFTIWDWNYQDGIKKPDKINIWGKGNITPENIDTETRKQMPEMFDHADQPRNFYQTDVLQRLGYDVILCSSTRSAGDNVFCGQHNIHAPNVAGAATKAKKRDLLGHCVTSWAIRIFNYELQQVWLNLAGLYNKMDAPSYEELINKSGWNIFTADPTDFYRAIDMIGLPFSCACSGIGSGIQWNLLKDSTYPPEDYLKNKISEWQNDEQKFVDMKNMIQIASTQIPKGIELLQKFAHQAQTGQAIIKEWLFTGICQLKTLNCVREIFKQAEKNISENNSKLAIELELLKDNYKNWAIKWMTQHSANLNTDLIFQTMIDFL